MIDLKGGVMRKLIVLMLLSPFLVCDPQPGVGITSFQLDGLWVATVAAEADGSFRLDLADAVQGESYTVRAKACTELWGCSDWSVPFEFTRPDMAIPANMRLGK